MREGRGGKITCRVQRIKRGLPLGGKTKQVGVKNNTGRIYSPSAILQVLSKRGDTFSNESNSSCLQYSFAVPHEESQFSPALTIILDCPRTRCSCRPEDKRVPDVRLSAFGKFPLISCLLLFREFFSLMLSFFLLVSPSLLSFMNPNGSNHGHRLSKTKAATHIKFLVHEPKSSLTRAL